MNRYALLPKEFDGAFDLHFPRFVNFRADLLHVLFLVVKPDLADATGRP